MFPIWSPSGEELAYFDGSLKVVDVATGTARTLATTWQATPRTAGHGMATGSCSRARAASRRRMARTLWDLWAVGVDGGEPTLLVEGATHGAWQP